MKRFLPLTAAFFILLAVAVALPVMETASATGAKEMTEKPMNLEAAKATFEATCGKCHALSRPLGKKKDKDGWESTVQRMSAYHQRNMGAAIPEEDQKAIVEYLLSVAGK